ncbi:MAG: twin-arginine translocase TatA/TatE family subunit [Polyangiaceae bacterium]
MGSLSPIHWVIVLIIVLLVFGPGRLAGVGKGLGEGIRSFKKGLNEDLDEPPPTAAKAPEEKPQLPENRSS